MSIEDRGLFEPGPLRWPSRRSDAYTLSRNPRSMRAKPPERKAEADDRPACQIHHVDERSYLDAEDEKQAECGS